VHKLRIASVLLACSMPLQAEVDPTSGLFVDTGFEQVKAQCTACHSSRLIVQNRSTREGWLEMIRWMQDKQGLWPLGDNETVILDYLARNYGPASAGRRAPLQVEKWQWPK
jgi:hypothetical protein